LHQKWSQYSSANNYQDISQFFTALSDNNSKGFGLYKDLFAVWRDNKNMFKIESQEFSQGISLIMSSFQSYFTNKATLNSNDINMFSYLFQMVFFYFKNV
jgi:hypothetical protein